ncbi:MAG: MaoC/PaaZ C-terminal domain-containing protein [Desulfosarcinaceae bacterium]|nr:MaoC/PaaZ C-terminal domain-containing protein [Desulfosarcinaceae bacterium]
MALRRDRIGTTIRQIPFRYNRDTLIQYALGIGCGSDAADLGYIYEKELTAFPTFAVVPFMAYYMTDFIAYAGLDLQHLLHGEHHIALHRPMPLEGTVFTDFVWEAVFDKGDTGALIQTSSVTKTAKGERLYENQALFLDRSAGNFGGERGPRVVPRDMATLGAPAFRERFTTSPRQAALYRLSGDKNPLHIDPDFARRSGFAQPILHGLCSFAIACRAAVKRLCDDDPARLASFGARFTGAVTPGDVLITTGWAGEAPGSYHLQATNQEGLVVLANAVLQLRR